MNATTDRQLPNSVSNMPVNLIGLICSMLVCAYTLKNHAISDMMFTFLVVLAFTLPTLFIEIFYLECYKSQNAGLNFDLPAQASDWITIAVKFVGLTSTLAGVAFLYWLFPEYQTDFYHDYFHFLGILAPYCIIVMVPYFILINQYMVDKHDAYWHLGMLCLGYRQRVDMTLIKEHVLGWLIKAFFLPLMVQGFMFAARYLRGFDLSTVLQGYTPFYLVVFHLIVLVDGMIAIGGYLCTFRLLNAHIRKPEINLLGWVVCLVCYHPLWNYFSQSYVNYNLGPPWGYWLSPYGAIYVIWGTTILLLLAVYVIATVAFGLRFSNLTHRGIITCGPYKYSKHPAYICKNTVWWMMSMPFMAGQSLAIALKACLLLTAVNIIYTLRAKSEEKHLAFDPEYIAYSKYIAEYGLISRLKRIVQLASHQIKQYHHKHL